MEWKTIVQQALEKVRQKMVAQYGVGTDLCGHCIEASDWIAEELIQSKMADRKDIRVVEGWCVYDDPCCCSDLFYDAHTWMEVIHTDTLYYLDVTADQFNANMFEENEFSPIIFQVGRPNAMVLDEPSEEEDQRF